MTREVFHTYCLFRWLTGDPILLERYIDIAHDTKLCTAQRIAILQAFVKTVRDATDGGVDWNELIDKGLKIPNHKKEAKKNE